MITNVITSAGDPVWGWGELDTYYAAEKIYLAHQAENITMTFRFLVTGKFKFVNDRMEIEDGHYLKGAIFDSHNLEPISNNHMPGEARELDGEPFFQLHGYTVQVAFISPFDDFQPLEDSVVASFLPSMLVSADGIPALTPNIPFCLSIVGESHLCGAREFESEIYFSSDNYTQGIKLELLNDNCIRSLESRNYLHLRDSFDNSFKLSGMPPASSDLQLIPARRHSTFVFFNGKKYFNVEFFKASYGEALPVEKLEEATVFQLICPGILSAGGTELNE